MSKYRCIHIAGTNGKGSIAHYLANIFKAAGKRCGLFTSPHLLSWQERIQIDGENIDMPDAFEETLYEGGYFINTAKLAKDVFEAASLDYAVIETGIGGKKDITMMFDADIAVITTVGMDHADILGDSLESIAYQKAGIIRKNNRVYSHPQKRKVSNIIHQHAFLQRANLTELKEKQIKHIRFDDEMILFDFEYSGQVYKDIKLSSCAKVQTLNAGVAFMLALDEGIDERAIRAGLLLPIKGRTEIFDDHVLLDVAHNEDAFLRLKETVRKHFPKQKVHLMFAAQKTKDIKSIAKIIGSFADAVYLVEMEDDRFFLPKDISRYFKNPMYISGKKAALENAFKNIKSRSDDGVLVVCGSFVLTGRVYPFISSV